MWLVGCAGGCGSIAPEPRCASGKGQRCSTLHSDSIHAGDDGLEAPEKASAVEGVSRGWGVYSETTKEVEGEEAAFCGGWPGGSNAPDADAGERDGKRTRTSASRHDAGTPTYAFMFHCCLKIVFGRVWLW